jgi:hypothetical protein
MEPNGTNSQCTISSAIQRKEAQSGDLLHQPYICTKTPSAPCKFAYRSIEQVKQHNQIKLLCITVLLIRPLHLQAKRIGDRRDRIQVFERLLAYPPRDSMELPLEPAIPISVLIENRDDEVDRDGAQRGERSAVGEEAVEGLAPGVDGGAEAARTASRVAGVDVEVHVDAFEGFHPATGELRQFWDDAEERVVVVFAGLHGVELQVAECFDGSVQNSCCEACESRR